MGVGAQEGYLVSKILTALLKHQVKKLIGEEALGIVAGELAESGIGQLGSWIDSQLGNETIVIQITEASQKADACFLEECQDPNLKEAMISLPLHGLPEVDEALLALPEQFSEKQLTNTLRTVMERDWKGLSADQIDHAVNLYLTCIQRALMPVERYTLLFIDLTLQRFIDKFGELEARTEEIKVVIEKLKESFASGVHPIYLPPPPPPPPGILPAPGGLPIGSHIPFEANDFFTGRKEDLFALRRALLDEIPDKPGIRRAVVLTGMGGIGKTQLAIEFCYRYGRFFHGVLWVRADQDIQAAIAEYGAGMSLEPWPEDVSSRFRRTIIAWQQIGLHLVVLDNVENQDMVQTWLPRLANARILITSRLGQWPRDLPLQELPLKTLPRPESLSLLRKLAPRLNSIQDDQLNPVPERLGDLPLALDLAGRYLSVDDDLPPADYLRELDEADSFPWPTTIPGWEEYSPTRAGTNLAATFHLSWAKLEDQEALAKQAFLTCVFCPPNTPIPKTVFLATAGEDTKRPSRRVNLALHRLYQIGLLVSTEYGPSIHPLMREFADLIVSETGKAEFIQGLETNLLWTLDDPLNRVQNALNAGDALLFLAQDPQWKTSQVRGPVLSSLIELLTQANAPISERRRAALLLTHLEWLEDIATFTPDKMLEYLELAGRYVYRETDRRYILDEITIPILESETADLTLLQSAQFLVFQAAMRAQLLELQGAKADYEQACRIANTWKTTDDSPSLVDLILARVRLGLGHHLAIEAGEHPAGSIEHHLGLDQAIDLFQASLDSAEYYGKDPVLQAYIYNELSWIEAQLKNWPEAINQYQKALQILEQPGAIAQRDPEAVAICRAKILDNASLVHFTIGMSLPENSSEAFAEYQTAYQLVSEEIQLLDQEMVREVEEQAVAQLNAGDYLRLIGEQLEKDKTATIVKACEHWTAARIIANRLGIKDVADIANERLKDPIGALQQIIDEEPGEE